MQGFCFLFLLFITFSIIGWIIECIYCSIIEKRIIVNRGYLIGPYCPIYGLGVVYGYTFLTLFESNPLLVFIMGMIGASILEYITSYAMEKAFNARWWDYSNEILNINGRICFKNALMFGVIGILFIYYGKPLYLDLVNMLPDNALMIISISIMIIFIIDNIISVTIMSKIKNKFKSLKKDSTEEIEKEVNNVLKEYYFYSKKLFKAFPNVSFKLKTGNDIKNAINKVLHKNVKNK